jgi:hypothetical protein
VGDVCALRAADGAVRSGTAAKFWRLSAGDAR